MASRIRPDANRNEDNESRQTLKTGLRVIRMAAKLVKSKKYTPEQRRLVNNMKKRIEAREKALSAPKERTSHKPGRYSKYD